VKLKYHKSHLLIIASTSCREEPHFQGTGTTSKWSTLAMKVELTSLQVLAIVFGLKIGGANSQYPPASPKPKGLRISWVGHSFHVYLPGPVAKLASEAGIKGHRTLGVDFIGASMPCQHWNRGGGENGTNAVKNILKAAKADVQTLSTQQPNPDPCVPKFARLAVGHPLASFRRKCLSQNSTNIRRTCA
jgi:hypothetical protein